MRCAGGGRGSFTDRDALRSGSALAPSSGARGHGARGQAFRILNLLRIARNAAGERRFARGDAAPFPLPRSPFGPMVRLMTPTGFEPVSQDRQSWSQHPRRLAHDRHMRENWPIRAAPLGPLQIGKIGTLGKLDISVRRKPG
jgi:hypothetical protein